METEQLSRDQRRAAGKAARSDVPLESHAVLDVDERPRSGRAAAGAGRVPGAGARADPARPDARPRRSRSTAAPRCHGRRPGADARDSGLRVQLCGDAHLSNFGVFASPERRLVFDINDFDETLPGPFEWDVKRLAASFAVAGRENGFSRRKRRGSRARRGRRYRDRDARVRRPCASSTSGTPAWTSTTAAAQLGASCRRKAGRSADREAVAKARTRDSLQAFEQAHHRGRRASPGSSATRRSSCRSRSCSTGDVAGAWTSGSAACSARTPDACSRDRRHLLEQSLRPHGPQGGRRRQRRAPAPGSCCCSGRRRRGPAVPPGQGGAGVGARPTTAARARTTTRASGSSPGSS